jgi:hypothetical protein
MSTSELLISKYGPLMTLEELAEVLKRSVDGLRVCLSKKSPFYGSICAARVHLGRRLYFSSEAVGAILDGPNGKERAGQR